MRGRRRGRCGVGHGLCAGTASSNACVRRQPTGSCGRPEGGRVARAVFPFFLPVRWRRPKHDGSSIGWTMNKQPRAELSALESRLGYSFRDSGLAVLARRQVSAQNSGGPGRVQSYQRLEIRGGRGLGVVHATRLYQAFPKASEGELLRRLAKLVRRETCAEIASQWDVGPHVALGLGEARGGGGKKQGVL